MSHKSPELCIEIVQSERRKKRRRTPKCKTNDAQIDWNWFQPEKMCKWTFNGRQEMHYYAGCVFHVRAFHGMTKKMCEGMKNCSLSSSIDDQMCSCSTTYTLMYIFNHLLFYLCTFCGDSMHFCHEYKCLTFFLKLAIFIPVSKHRLMNNAVVWTTDKRF